MSHWERRSETRQNDKAHGITFVMFERSGENIRAEAAVKAKKLHVDGCASLTLALDQWKFGDELIAQLYSKGEYRVLERQADGWTRVQIFLGPADIATAEMLESIAREIRSRSKQHGGPKDADLIS